ncbi:unnamed protein product [Sympodiomycopsis kandeliae]
MRASIGSITEIDNLKPQSEALRLRPSSDRRLCPSRPPNKRFITMASSKRITKELSDLTRNPLPGITVTASESNVYAWTAILQGPEGTPYEKGHFKLSIDFPVEYPFKGPKIKFQTRVYHPNIDDDGNLCVGLLKSDAWKPSTKADTILNSIIQLLSEPNPDDALVASIAEQYNKDRAKFDQTAKEYTQKYAGAEQAAQ